MDVLHRSASYESPLFLAGFLKGKLDTLGLKSGQSMYFDDSYFGELFLQYSRIDHLSACGELSTHTYRFSLVSDDRDRIVELNRDNLTVATIETGQTIRTIDFGKGIENKTLKDKGKNLSGLVTMVCRLAEEHTLLI